VSTWVQSRVAEAYWWPLRGRRKQGRQKKKSNNFDTHCRDALNLAKLPSGGLCQKIHLITEELKNILVLTNGAAVRVKKKKKKKKGQRDVSILFSVFRTRTLRKSRKRRSISPWEIRIMDGVTHSHRFVSAASLLLAIYTLSLKAR